MEYLKSELLSREHIRRIIRNQRQWRVLSKSTRDNVGLSSLVLLAPAYCLSF